MKTDTRVINEVIIAVVSSGDMIISDVGSAIDFIATVSYETGCHAVILNKEAVSEDFFDLKTKIAGEILQKFVQYHMKLAIVGDFSRYSSKSLKDFFYECNKGRDLFFVSDEETAIEKLAPLR
ncbi:DUF4180 domain-containing protein [Anoxybacterium hadale]|uniref:DUF4180 domain-containing protein n=1 Tax=Anoxybacterium hadale TaxID=3408580 RepID=A0ACD1AE74_9FIRM|nr:DUF4180 domain-containing protein [Clostridiales bacterium]